MHFFTGPTGPLVGAFWCLWRFLKYVRATRPVILSTPCFGLTLIAGRTWQCWNEGISECLIYVTWWGEKILEENKNKDVFFWFWSDPKPSLINLQLCRRHTSSEKNIPRWLPSSFFSADTLGLLPLLPSLCHTQPLSPPEIFCQNYWTEFYLLLIYWLQSSSVLQWTEKGQRSQHWAAEAPLNRQVQPSCDEQPLVDFSPGGRGGFVGFRWKPVSVTTETKWWISMEFHLTRRDETCWHVWRPPVPPRKKSSFLLCDMNKWVCLENQRSSSLS